MRFQGLNAVFSQNFRLRTGTQHERHIRAVNIGVEQADLMTEPSHGNRQVHRKRRLADAAFSGSDSNDCFHARQRLRGWRLLSGTRW